MTTRDAVLDWTITAVLDYVLFLTAVLLACWVSGEWEWREWALALVFTVTALLSAWICERMERTR